MDSPRGAALPGSCAHVAHQRVTAYSPGDKQGCAVQFGAKGPAVHCLAIRELPLICWADFATTRWFNHASTMSSFTSTEHRGCGCASIVPLYQLHAACLAHSQCTPGCRPPCQLSLLCCSQDKSLLSLSLSFRLAVGGAACRSHNHPSSPTPFHPEAWQPGASLHRRRCLHFCSEDESLLNIVKSGEASLGL